MQGFKQSFKRTLIMSDLERQELGAERWVEGYENSQTTCKVRAYFPKVSEGKVKATCISFKKTRGFF